MLGRFVCMLYHTMHKNGKFDVHRFSISQLMLSVLRSPPYETYAQVASQDGLSSLKEVINAKLDQAFWDEKDFGPLEKVPGLRDAAHAKLAATAANHLASLAECSRQAIEYRIMLLPITVLVVLRELQCSRGGRTKCSELKRSGDLE